MKYFGTVKSFDEMTGHGFIVPEKGHVVEAVSVEAVGGAIPGNFMPAIEKGFLERLKQGVVAGFPVQNVCVEVYYGKDHPVDSNEAAFRIADAFGVPLERVFRWTKD